MWESGLVLNRSDAYLSRFERCSRVLGWATEAFEHDLISPLSVLT
jgi:hypothetical protein